MDKIRKKERKNWFYSYNMIFEQAISTHAKLIYLFLCRCADDESECFPSHKYIGNACSIKSRTTVQNAIKELQDIGLVDKEPQYRENGGQSSNLYYIYDSPKPVDEVDLTPCPLNGHPPAHEMVPPPAHEMDTKYYPSSSKDNPEERTTTCAEDVVVSHDEIKNKIDNTIKGDIDPEALTNLIKNCGIEKIIYVIDNWEGIVGNQNIQSSVEGFFKRAVENGWKPGNKKPSSSNRNNFDQRDLPEEYFENFYIKSK